MTHDTARRLRTLWVALALVALASGRPRAEEDAPSGRDLCLADSQCRSLYAGARALFKDKQYEGALSGYQQAYNVRQSAWLLINIGRTYYRLGKPREALEYFQRYQQVTATADVEIQKRLSRYIGEATELLAHPAAPEPAPPTAASLPAAAALEPEVAAARPSAATAGPSPAPTAAAPQTAAASATPATQAMVSTVVVEKPAAPRPLYKRPWFWAVVGVAVAGGVTGAVAGTLAARGTDTSSAIQIPPQAMHFMPSF